jgi:hypothetical protein
VEFLRVNELASEEREKREANETLIFTNEQRSIVIVEDVEKINGDTEGAK